MPHHEFLAWMGYVEKRGTLNLGMRLEFLFARLGAQVAQAAGGKKTTQDFLRFQDEEEANLDDIAALLGGKTKRNSQ